MADVTTNRRDPRYPLTLVAKVTELVNSTVWNARSSDVSRGGCYIDTLNPMLPGTQVKVQLWSGDEEFETSARVVYICPGLGMGVHWGTNPPETQLAVLDRWLQEAASNSD
jgi:PilZ domain